MRKGESYRYKAFISYRHVDRDRRWARWLIEGLETYRVPRALVNAGYPERIGTLFRDDDEIPASGDLSNQIEEALDQSEFLIVICSPDTPESQWVRREIQYFQEQDKGDRILALLVEGEPAESFPPELRFVEREVTGDDGVTRTVQEEVEPLAADVRPRTDEPKKVTELRARLRIAAGLLRCRFDDLFQRDAQRAARRRRMAVSAIAACLIAVVSGGAYWWDQTRIKTRYFAAYGTAWGIPFGIGKLDEAVQKRRNESFAIDTRGGRIIAMRKINGSGGLRALKGDNFDGEPWLKGVAKWEFVYAGEKRLSTVRLSNDKGRVVMTPRYEHLSDGRVVVSFRKEGGTQTLAAGGTDLSGDLKPSSSRKTEIAQHRITFNDKGYVATRRFETASRYPAADSTGSYGRQYSYTKLGQISRLLNFDARGKPIVGKSGVESVTADYDRRGDTIRVSWWKQSRSITFNAKGVAFLQRKRDAVGNETEESYYGIDDNPVHHKDGPYRVTMNYDNSGNLITQTYFGIDGVRSLHKDGLAEFRSTYDDYGRLITQTYFGINGKPIFKKGGYHKVTVTYDHRGRLIKESFSGFDGKLVVARNGWAELTLTYDGRDNVIEKRVFGADGKPILSKDGMARATKAYDNRGNLIEEDYFGIDGKLILSKHGMARITQAYDKRGNLIEKVFLGTGGKPILSKNGMARVTKAYNDNAHLIKEDYFGTDDKPILSKEGIARVTQAYDKRGNLIKQAFFGTDGNPILNKYGMARITKAYNDNGRLIEEDFFGTDDKPTLSKKGVARVTQAYDDLSNLIERAFFGIDGKPVLSKYGVARLTKAYDDRSNLIELAYFDTDGKPVLSKDGVARLTKAYDDRNNLIELAFFDPKDKPTLNKKGVARVTQAYDDRGNMMEAAFFGADNKPVRSKLGWAKLKVEIDYKNRRSVNKYLDETGSVIKEIHKSNLNHLFH